MPNALRSVAYLVLGALLLAAQSNEKRVAPVSSDQAARFNRADTVGVAILVGVGKYPLYSGLSHLQYPAVDVDTLAATLKSQRYAVLSLKDSDATKEAVLNAISQAGEALAGENQTVVFFFSGHGFAVNGENYFGHVRCRDKKPGQQRVEREGSGTSAGENGSGAARPLD